MLYCENARIYNEVFWKLWLTLIKSIKANVNTWNVKKANVLLYIPEKMSLR